MRAQAFIDEPLRAHIFETIKYRDELVRMMVMLSQLAGPEASERAGRVLRGEVQ